MTPSADDARAPAIEQVGGRRADWAKLTPKRPKLGVSVLNVFIVNPSVFRLFRVIPRHKNPS